MNLVSNGGGMSPSVLEAVNGPRSRGGPDAGPSLAAPGAPAGAAPTSAAGGAAVATPPGAAKSGAELQNTFMRLLVTEMKNQDPTNPMDSSQMTSQLAQINTVSGIAGLNSTMSSLAAQMNATNQVTASGLIGKEVLANGNDITMTKGAPTSFGVNVGAAASAMDVTISDATGKPVRAIKMGATPAGMTPLTWDGKMDNGMAAPDGKYTFKVTAANGDDPVTTTTLGQSRVQSVIQQPNGTAGLRLANGGTTSLTGVAQIL